MNRYLGITLGTILAGLLALSGAFGQTATLLPNATQYFMDNNGKPLSNGNIYFYVPGTTSPKTVWTDSSEATPQLQPVPLGSSGRPVNPIYGDGCYRQIATDQFNNIIWDFPSCSTGSGGGGGGGGVIAGDGLAVGTIIPWAGTALPANYLYTAGQTVSRSTYNQLFVAITYSATVLCQSGINTLTVPTAISDGTPINAPIESSCFASGTIVTAKSSGLLTLNNTANVTASSSLTVFPWGNGDGSTTFTVPDLRGRVYYGRDNMNASPAGTITSTYFGANPDALGAQGGTQNQTLARANLPNTNVPVTITDPGHTHGFSVGGNNPRVFYDGGTAYGYPSGNSLGISTPTIASATTGISASFNLNNNVAQTAFSILQPGVTSDYIIKAIPNSVIPFVLGFNVLPSSTLATATVLPNSPTYNNGTAGVGATLTAGSNSTLTVDGTVANLNAVVLVNQQASAFQNGIYTVTTAGSGSVPWVLTRATYFNSSTQMLSGSYTYITGGTTQLGTSWVLETTVAVVGTNPANFAQFSASSSIAGVNGNVQYNSGGVLAGNGGFNYDGTSKVTLGVTGSSVGGLALANATSGTVTLAPTTGALGSAVATFPANSGTVAELNLAQTWTAGQTFSSTFNSTGTFQISGAAQTFPASGLLVGTTDTQTLTGKTINCASNTCTVRIGSDVSGLGTGVATALGNATNAAGGFPTYSGSFGTPTSLTLTNATGLPIAGVTGWGTGVVTALAVNVGSAGAFVVNGGALGSPSSAGTIPAFTLGGTVSGGGNNVNNVNVGAVSPGTGAFTSLSASGTVSGTGFSNYLVTYLASPPAIGGTTPAAGSFTTLGWSSTATGTSSSATALAVGPNGTTNPALNIDASTGSLAAGLNVKGAVTGGTVAVSTIDSGSNTNLTINGKGTGTIGIGTVSTGGVNIVPALTLGTAGSAVGSVAFANATSGAVKLQPATGALGSAVITIPDITDTMAGFALANGGTNNALTASNGGIVYSDASKLQILPGTSTAAQCLLSGANAAPTWGSCSGGGAAVSSVANSDGTLTISPTTGAVAASLALGHANTWTAAQTFTNSDILLLGSSTGYTTFTSANAGATNYTITVPAVTDTLLTLTNVKGAGGEVASTSGSVVTLQSPGGNLNKFRNGTFDVWQRSTASLATSTSGAYTADGWIVTQAGAAFTCAQDTGNNGTLHSLKCVGGTSNTDTTFKQRIESSVAAPLAGGTITVQFQFKQDTGSSITPKISTCYASATDNFGTCTGDLAATSLTACASATWCTESYTLSASASASNGYQITLDCNTALTSSQHCWISAADVRVTPGVTTGVNSNPPPPEIRNIAVETVFCQRYLNTSYPSGNAPGAATTAGMAQVGIEISGTAVYAANVGFPSTMRAAPTLTFWDGAGNSGKISYIAQNTSTFTNNVTNVGSGAFNTSANGFYFLASVSSQTVTFWTHYVASAEL